MNDTSDNHGSARWASLEDFRREGLFCFESFEHDSYALSQPSSKASYVRNAAINRAFILGKLQSPEILISGVRQTKGLKSQDTSFLGGLMDLFNDVKEDQPQGRGDLPYIGWAGDGHILTIAPTRSGKGVGVVTPNLLHYPGSVLVMDPKGENYAMTHRYRQDVLGQDIVCLDPFHIIEENFTDSINPFEGLVDYNKPSSNYLTQNPELLDEINVIIDSIIIREPGDKDPHWNDKCATLLKLLIMGIISGYSPNNVRNLTELRFILTMNKVDYETLILRMQYDSAALGGKLQRAANEVMSMGVEERNSVFSVALRQTEFLDSPLIMNALSDQRRRSQGTYNIRNLKNEGNVSIYIILPPHYMARYIRVVRLWITLAMAAMTRDKQQPADGCSVLFILDEIAQLGSLDMLKQAISLLAGYGMTLWMIWQDISQIKALYEHDWPSFLANAKIQQYFGINDHETADFLSKMIGNATIYTESHNEGSSRESGQIFGNSSTSKNVSFSELSRSLLNPDEVRRLNRETMLIFVQGMPPLMAERISHFMDMPFSERADSNPYIS